MTGIVGGFDPGMLAQLKQLTQQNSGKAASNPSESEVQFKDFVLNSIGQVNDMQQNAEVAIETLVTGGDINPAQVFTAIQKADMSFRMMQQIRNKLVDAYNELKEIRV